MIMMGLLSHHSSFIVIILILSTIIQHQVQSRVFNQRIISDDAQENVQSLESSRFQQVTTYQILSKLEKNATKVYYNNRQVPCYQWTCTHSEPGIKPAAKCEYCLPHLIVSGFNKCGTTALDTMLGKHPNFTLYREKEINVFEQLYYSPYHIRDLSQFEDHVGAHEEYRRSSSFKTTKLWVDGSNAISWEPYTYQFVRRFDPLIKVLFIVRDPYQAIASFYSMNHREEIIKNNWYHKDSIEYSDFIEGKILSDFESLLPRLDECYDAVKKARRYRSSDPMFPCISGMFSPFYYYFPEFILSWKKWFGRNLTIIDHHNLQSEPEKVIHSIERFLDLPLVTDINHRNNEVQLNTFGYWGVNTTGAVNSEYFHYSQETLKVLVPLFSSSLDFFERSFGWKIHLQANYSDSKTFRNSSLDISQKVQRVQTHRNLQSQASVSNTQQKRNILADTMTSKLYLKHSHYSS